MLGKGDLSAVIPFFGYGDANGWVSESPPVVTVLKGRLVNTVHNYYVHILTVFKSLMFSRNQHQWNNISLISTLGFLFS